MLEANNDIDFSSHNDIPIEEVVAQMEKELQMSGEKHVFTSESSEDLVNELSNVLKSMDSGSRISNLFYRIDVDIRKANSNISTYRAYSILAWNRVFKKVWFRRNFKTGSK